MAAGFSPHGAQRTYNKTVKTILLFLFLTALVLAQGTEGNFKIRFEPTAKLQTAVEVPFTITVTDSRLQPVSSALIHMTCRLADDTSTEVRVEGKMVTAGTYIAKPIFPKAGTYDVRVEVVRNDKTTSRSIQYNVAD